MYSRSTPPPQLVNTQGGSLAPIAIFSLVLEALVGICVRCTLKPGLAFSKRACASCISLEPPGWVWMSHSVITLGSWASAAVASPKASAALQSGAGFIGSLLDALFFYRYG